MTVTEKGLQQQQRHNICSDVRLSEGKCCFTDYTIDLWHKHEGSTVRIIDFYYQLLLDK